jgi:1,2-dihydroxy-3-keto-5-methylthiopentene dioxygenase
MAVVRIPDQQRELTDLAQIEACLAPFGVTYQRWEPSQPVGEDAPSEEILAAYASEIETLKQQGGYVTADVVDLKPSTEGLDGLLAKFRREHWHDEDEVRFTIKGRGVFRGRSR